MRLREIHKYSREPRGRIYAKRDIFVTNLSHFRCMIFESCVSRVSRPLGQTKRACARASCPVPVHSRAPVGNSTLPNRARASVLLPQSGSPQQQNPRRFSQISHPSAYLKIFSLIEIVDRDGATFATLLVIHAPDPRWFLRRCEYITVPRCRQRKREKMTFAD